MLMTEIGNDKGRKHFIKKSPNGDQTKTAAYMCPLNKESHEDVHPAILMEVN